MAFPVSPGLVPRLKPSGRTEANLTQKTRMGENVIVWCDENGRSCIAGDFARTWACIWGPPREGAYMVADSPVPSMALSTMQPATALPIPLPTHPGPRGGESSRHSRSPALSSPGGGPRNWRRYGT